MGFFNNIFTGGGKHAGDSGGGKKKAIGKHAKPIRGKHGKPAKGSGRNADRRDYPKGGAADGLDRWG